MASVQSSAEDLILDIDKLSGDSGEIYLFQWLTRCEQALASLPLEELKSHQSQVESTLTNVVLAPSPFPTPGRPTRNLVARCLIVLFTRGETRSLFDCLTTLSRVVADPKAPNPNIKLSCLYVVGEIMAVFGSQARIFYVVMSFMGEITISTLKIVKTSSNSVQMRYHAFVALRKSLESAARAATDSMAKDIIKQSKSGLTDKSLAVQRASADVLRVMYAQGRATGTVGEIESIVSLCVKSLDSADQLTRRSLASLIAHLLMFTQTESIPVVPPPSKKSGNKEKDEESDDETNPRSAVEAAPKTLLQPGDMLNLLSVWFNKLGVSRRVRVGIIDFYATLLAALGSSYIEAHYLVIVRHLLTEIAGHQRNLSTRHDALLIRQLIGTLLRDVIGIRMLSEQGQIGAIKELSTSYLQKWPALMPGQVAPVPQVLVIALKEVAGLVQQLGNAPPPVQEALADPLIELLGHPSHSVRIATAWCLRSFCYSTPLRLPKSILTVMDLLQRDIAAVIAPSSSSDVHRRILGHANGLAALFSIIPERPLYVSYDLSAKILDTAIQLLKRAGDHDLAVAGVEIETAWTCISSLMTLGPNFVRAHISQLLVLWRNALPKPTSKDTTNGITRSNADWNFLLRIRESALSAILSFLLHNSPTLVTLDVVRRLSSLLSNALQFSNAFVSQYREELHEPPGVASTEISLSLREAMLRRRVFQCFSALGFSSLPESTHSLLLQSTINLFASPDGFLGSSAQAAIASSSGMFISLWQVTDGYAYGVTSVELDTPPSLRNEESTSQEKLDPLNRDAVEGFIDQMVSKPIIGSIEHDSLVLCRSRTVQSAAEPPPASTGVVDAAIELFSLLLPLQDLPSTVRALRQLVDAVRSPKLEKNLGRKSAVFLNATYAIVLALRQAMQSHGRQARETLGNPQVTSILADFLKGAILDEDIALRFTGSEAIGRLANLAGTAFLSAQITSLVDQVVNNRNPHCRAGCALAFGAIYGHVGGLAAGPLLKTTVNVLMSLSNDPHPVVHYWALTSLAQVINAANLSYSPYIASTLGMLVKLYASESHEPEGGSLVNVNIRGDLPAYQVICQIIDALIGVLGPELQESAKTRSLILDLVNQLSIEVDEGIQVEAIKCIQHLLIFGSGFMQISDLVNRFRGNLSSTRRPLKLVSINALYALVQKDAFALSKLGGDRLVEDLFGMLDDDSSIDGVRSVITSWLQQTVVHNPSGWIDLCQRIMSRSNAFQQTSGAGGKQAIAGLDDEGESLSVGMAKDQPSIGLQRSTATSRWRTQLFALQCLHLICTTVASSSRPEHLDLHYARSHELQETMLLVSRVPDLIKMAFVASAAYVTEIRLEGLIVLRDIIEIFAKSPDPDYAEALLLEQHQAPITAALTPAFSSDSTPEILASAIEVCAVFVGCGVVKDVARMGRILKLLTSALEQCKESGTLSIGEAQELSPNASVMLRVSTLTAWAELEVAGVDQHYLDNVLKPHRGTLASLWIGALRDYASIRADSEVLQETVAGSMDVAYTGLGREVLLPYYVDSWAKILNAVSTAMRSDSDDILAAMDGLDNASTLKRDPTRTESTAYYSVILGLVFEALVANSTDATSSSAASQYTALTALDTLRSLVRPEYSGSALFDPAVFGELTGLFYRMTLTEPPDIQLRLLEAIRCIVASRDPVSLRGGSPLRSFPQDLPLTHCLRICAYALRHAISNASGWSSESPAMAQRGALIREGFLTFMTVGNAFGNDLREEVRSIAVLLYSGLLKDETSVVDLVGPTLPALKSLLEKPATSTTDAEHNLKYERLVHGLLSACLQNVDDMGGRQGVAPTLKVKNNMLAAVLIVTIVPSSVKLSQPALEHCCFLISQRLSLGDESTGIAAHCAKTLISAAAAGSVPLQSCVKLLLPGIIAYLANVAARTRQEETGPPQVESDLQGTEEVLKAFTILFSSFPENTRSHALGVFMPVLIILLDTTRSPPTPIHSLAVTHLIGFASSSSAAFKEATGKLDLAERETLETAVRQAVEGMKGSGAATTAQSTKRQISLRTF